MAELDGITYAFLALAFGAALLFLLNYRRFSKQSRKKVEELWSKTNSLEGEAVALKAEMEELEKTLSEKIDYSYLDKRIEGLVNLMKSKAT